jgi:uncharacterized damage-inducible protein DinB
MIGELVEVLQQGRDLLKQIDDNIFLCTIPPMFNYGIGSHIRHCLDFYSCFLHGLETGYIDYDSRGRDERIEKDHARAIQKIDVIIKQMSELVIANEQMSVSVRLEDATNDHQWSYSSIARELQSLKSHTIHHYALIAVLLRLQGIEPGEEFGVSTSTLRQRRAA